MSSVRRVFIALLASVGLLLAAALAVPVANAAEPTLRTFVVQLSAENEGLGCLAGVESGATGVAVVQINAATGQITYRVVAFNLPGTVTVAHIHPGAAGVSNPPAEGGGLEVTGLSTGLVAEGSTINLALATLILANPENFYVNVHTTTCQGGAVRGQLA